MRFALTLGLDGLEQRLPAGARFRPFLGGILPIKGRELEHAPVREVAVVRNGEHGAAGLLLPVLHPLPEVFRVFRLEGGHGEDLVRLVLAVPVDDVAMQVVAAACVRGPLVGDEGGEAARLVVLLHDCVVLLPDRRRELRVHDRGRQPLVGLRVDELHGCGGSLFRARCHHLIPALHYGIGHQLRVTDLELGNDAHAVGMIGDGDPIERPR